MFMLDAQAQIIKSWVQALSGAADLMAVSIQAGMSGSTAMLGGAGATAGAGLGAGSGLGSGLAAPAVVRRASLASDDRPTAGAGRPTQAKAQTGQSWYRPPYRSPFDPLFWLEPMAPVTAPWPAAGDLVPGGYHMWGGSMPWQMMPWMALTSHFRPGGAGPASPVAAAWNPMAAMWPASVGQFTSVGQSTSAGPVADASIANWPADRLPGAYRNSSGHAVAHIVRQAPAGVGAVQAPSAAGSLAGAEWCREAGMAWLCLWLPRT